MKKLSLILLITFLSINLSCKSSEYPPYTFNNHSKAIEAGINITSFLRNISEKCFSLICHQDHSILMSINRDIIPLCPRCMGLHIGFIISCFSLMISTHGKIKISGALSSIVLFTGLGIIIIEWLLGQCSIIQANVLSRLLTGLVAGSILGLMLIMYKRDFINQDMSKQIVIGSPKIIGLVCLSSTGGFLILLSNNWIAIVTILLISVCMNFLIMIQTVFLRFLPFIQLIILKNENHETQISKTC